MPNFNPQFKKYSDFFRSKNLAQQTLKYEGNPALLVIDVQKKFCDPKNERGNLETKVISKRIQDGKKRNLRN